MIKIGSKVKFVMPIAGIDEGIVTDIDGAHITIEVKIKGTLYPIERYPNEVTE